MEHINELFCQVDDFCQTFEQEQKRIYSPQVYRSYNERQDSLFTPTW